MKPSELAEYLKVMREAGCMSAEVVIAGNAVRAVFAPPEPAPFGRPLDSQDEDPVPGDWKKAAP